MFIILCPHCNTYIEIEQINCAIFRHGVFKVNNIQIDPHLDKISCEKLINSGLIYGCGRPFKIENINNVLVATICEYI